MCKNLPARRAQSLTTPVSNIAIVVVGDTVSLTTTAELMAIVGDE
jgi:hypothetical protein